jgi:hypothetical protein
MTTTHIMDIKTARLYFSEVAQTFRKRGLGYKPLLVKLAEGDTGGHQAKYEVVATLYGNENLPLHSFHAHKFMPGTDYVLGEPRVVTLATEGSLAGNFIFVSAV